MKYEIPIMEVIEWEVGTLVVTLASTTGSQGGSVEFPEIPGEEDFE